MQQQVDQNTRQQIEQIVAEYRDAWNNHNAAEIAALYTKDGIVVTPAPQMVKNGQQEIQENYQKAFATFPDNYDSAVDQIISLGADAVMVVGQSHLIDSSDNKIDGHWTAVFVPEGGKLKIKMLTAFTNPPPAQSTASS
jgi:uncharacterized protein (TIGR02246 family)